MHSFNEKNISVLNDLIEICKDGQHGYTTAAEHMQDKDAELTRVFRNYAAQRTEYLHELQQALRSLGGDPDKHGSVSGSLHRGWLNLKSALTGHGPHAVLAECERGEDAAVHTYRDAINSADLDMDTRAIIQRQAAGVKEAHDRIKQLRDSVAYAHQ